VMLSGYRRMDTPSNLKKQPNIHTDKYRN
jgi:hypothetical protein